MAKRVLLLMVLAAATSLSAGAALQADGAYVHDRVREQLDREGQARVIVVMWDPALPEARARDWRQRGPAVRELVRRVTAGAPGFQVRRTYELYPYLAGTLDRTALRQLLASPWVTEVLPDRRVRAALDQSGPLIGQPAAQLAGYDGHGVAIAILDTGVDYRHPFFGGHASFPNAKVVGGYDFAYGDSDPMDDNGHGTHVAGIAAGSPYTVGAVTYRGIAPAATLVAYKVLDRDGYGYESDIVAALERCLVDQTTYNIRVVNMSISDDYWIFDDREDCDTSAGEVAYAYNDLAANGMVLVVAAGNASSTWGLAYPSCLSSALAVGASSKTDAIASFSNRGELLDIYGPGVSITSAQAGGQFVSYSGTSMAAPHVAGAAACVVNMINPTDPVGPISAEQVKRRLRLTGVQILDPTTNVATPRVDLARAMSPPTTGPDLVVTAISSTATTGFAGDTIPLTLSVRNQGDVGSAPCQAVAVLSPNRTASPQDAVVATVSVPALAPGETYTPASLQGTIPEVTAGSYYLGAFADSGYQVAEKDELNNSRLGSSLNLGAFARVAAQTIPAFMRKGQSYPVSITMVNDGPISWSAAQGFALAAVSPEGNAVWGVERVPIPGGGTVAPGSSVTFSFSVTAPSQPGWYPCHWRMARGNAYFGEAATGAARALVVDDATLGQDYPSVSGERVAFEDYRGVYGADYGIPAITVHNLLTGYRMMLPQDIQFPKDLWGYPLPPYEHLDVSYQWLPALSGPWVTWMADDLYDEDTDWWYFQVLAYNVDTPYVLPRRLTYSTTGPWDNWNPAIDGTLVVWEDYRNDPDRMPGLDFLNDNPDIYIADVSAPAGAYNTVPAYALCTAPGPQLVPRISGNIVVWEDWRDGWQSDIYAYDLSVDSDGDGTPNWKEPLAYRPNPDPAEIRLTDTDWYEMFPDVSGRTVVWLDSRRDYAGEGRTDIFMLNLDTMTPTGAVTGALTFRYQPRVDDNKLVWTDYRAGNLDIYWKDLDTGVEVPIAAGVVWHDLPDISGRRVVYNQGRTQSVWNVWAIQMLTNGSVGIHTFSDVRTDHWAFPWVEAVVAGGVTQGYPDGSYGPSVVASRDQMAVYIARALEGGDENVPDPTAGPSFSDVAETYWAYKYIEYCASDDVGVVQGYPDGTYKPSAILNRGAMAVFIARAMAGGDAGVPSYTGSPHFSDVLPGGAWDWAYKYVEYVRGEGVVTGYPDGTYRPADTVTRDQMAVYIARAFGLPTP